MSSPAEKSELVAAPVTPLSRAALYLTVLVIATSGLVYELLAGTLASYVLGDSVTQFSTTIGTYLFAMGIGSYASRYVRRDVAARFLEVEVCTALVGGLSAPLLFLAFAHAHSFVVILYAVIVVVGTLVGLEIPLLMRILKDELAFEDLVARVLTFDYIGALVGSLAFALVFVPELGLTRTSLSFGLVSALTAVAGVHVLRSVLTKAAMLRIRVLATLVAAILIVAFYYADELTEWTEASLYSDPIVLAEQSPYQRIVVTSQSDRLSLFLNGNLQFSSSDEHRYHEALVHPALLAAARPPKRVLILGGGDGLALREVFKHDSVEHVTLVDLDAAVVRVARRTFAHLNGGSLDDSRLTLVHEDAFVWLGQREPDAVPFDAAIVDFPDPNHFALGKLYTVRFYRLLQEALTRGAPIVVQSTSPLLARSSYWCIAHTMRAAGLHIYPYHASVPSFGEWGYVLASADELQARGAIPASLESELRFVNSDTLASLFLFAPDMSEVDSPINTLNEQTLVRLYEEESRHLEE